MIQNQFSFSKKSGEKETFQNIFDSAITDNMCRRLFDFFLTIFISSYDGYTSSYEDCLLSDISWIIQGSQATVMCGEWMLWGVKFRLILVDKGTIGKKIITH